MKKILKETTLKKDKSEIISLNKVKKIPFEGIFGHCDFIDENNIIYTTRNSSDSFLDSKDNKVNYFEINVLNIKENNSKILNPVQKIKAKNSQYHHQIKKIYSIVKEKMY